MHKLLGPRPCRPPLPPLPVLPWGPAPLHEPRASAETARGEHQYDVNYLHNTVIKQYMASVRRYNTAIAPIKEADLLQEERDLRSWLSRSASMAEAGAKAQRFLAYTTTEVVARAERMKEYTAVAAQQATMVCLRRGPRGLRRGRSRWLRPQGGHREGRGRGRGRGGDGMAWHGMAGEGRGGVAWHGMGWCIVRDVLGLPCLPVGEDPTTPSFWLFRTCNPLEPQSMSDLRAKTDAPWSLCHPEMEHRCTDMFLTPTQTSSLNGPFYRYCPKSTDSIELIRGNRIPEARAGGGVVSATSSSVILPQAPFAKKSRHSETQTPPPVSATKVSESSE